MWVPELVAAGLAAVRSPSFRGRVDYDAASCTYRNSAVYGGFPLGSIGTGGFGVGTEGGFVNLRINNNWMRPIPHAKGSFWALSCMQNGKRETRILRRAFSGGREYKSVRPIRDTFFTGRVPCFEMVFEDDLPIVASVRGFSPLIPHNVKDSTMPVAVFRVSLRNRSESPAQASFLFSWENIIGRGGTGQTGVDVGPRGIPLRLKGRLLYDSVEGNSQSFIVLKGARGLDFTTQQKWPENAHRHSVLGRYLLVVEEAPGVDITTKAVWDASADRPDLLDTFDRAGQVFETKGARERQTKKPSGALCASCALEPGEARELVFYFVWWTPGHVVEKDAPARAKRGDHCGVRVGHYYENHFRSAEDIAHYVMANRERLWRETVELHELVDASSLPHWLKNALVNAADSVLCNTVLPRDGTLYTIEGAGWEWLFGGLCGTMDQRLAAQPYTSTFFTELDKTEVEAFRLLHRDGAVPHGNGNCDLALGDADVPYGLPLRFRGALKKDDWPDLTMSTILQICRLYKITGDNDWLEQAWPDLLAMLNYLNRTTHLGVPEGGSSFDTLSFAGTSAYTATVYLAALDALADVAQDRAPDLVERLHAMGSAAADRIDAVLWEAERGYYHSSERRDTLFWGSMAGDWIARYSGLDPVLPAWKIRSHMAHQHRAIFEGNRRNSVPAAYPNTEATFGGRGVPTRIMGLFTAYSHAWQVVSYHGLELIYAGLVQEGLSTIQSLYDRMWKSGWPWSADLYGNAGPVYMTHPVLWALPNSLSGAALDMVHRTLRFSPRMLPGESLLSVPVCFPSFWALLSADGELQAASLRVVKHYGAPLRVGRLLLSGADGNTRAIDLSPPWALETGRTFSFSFVMADDH